MKRNTSPSTQSNKPHCLSLRHGTEDTNAATSSDSAVTSTSSASDNPPVTAPTSNPPPSVFQDAWSVVLPHHHNLEVQIFTFDSVSCHSSTTSHHPFTDDENKPTSSSSRKDELQRCTTSKPEQIKAAGEVPYLQQCRSFNNEQQMVGLRRHSCGIPECHMDNCEQQGCGMNTQSYSKTLCPPAHTADAQESIHCDNDMDPRRFSLESAYYSLHLEEPEMHESGMARSRNHLSHTSLELSPLATRSRKGCDPIAQRMIQRQHSLSYDGIKDYFMNKNPYNQANGTPSSESNHAMSSAPTEDNHLFEMHSSNVAHSGLCKSCYDHRYGAQRVTPFRTQAHRQIVAREFSRLRDLNDRQPVVADGSLSNSVFRVLSANHNLSSRSHSPSQKSSPIREMLQNPRSLNLLPQGDISESSSGSAIDSPVIAETSPFHPDQNRRERLAKLLNNSILQMAMNSPVSKTASLTTEPPTLNPLSIPSRMNNLRNSLTLPTLASSTPHFSTSRSLSSQQAVTNQKPLESRRVSQSAAGSSDSASTGGIGDLANQIAAIARGVSPFRHRSDAAKNPKMARLLRNLSKEENSSQAHETQ